MLGARRAEGGNIPGVSDPMRIWGVTEVSVFGYVGPVYLLLERVSFCNAYNTVSYCSSQWPPVRINYN